MLMCVCVCVIVVNVHYLLASFELGISKMLNCTSLLLILDLFCDIVCYYALEFGANSN